MESGKNLLVLRPHPSSMFRFRKGPKHASKVQEARLIKTARWLKEDPLKVIPECKGECLMCKFGKSKKLIEKIAARKDDQKYLAKASTRGTDLSKAVAVSLQFANEKKLPVLATAKTSKGDINYVKGGAKEKYLLGIQHFHDPTIRLFAYHDESKRGFYLYSWGDRIVCTGKEDRPPKGYWDKRMSSMSYNLKKTDDAYSCGHTSSGMPHTYISLSWKGTGYKVELCYRCARTNVNLFTHLTEGMLSKDNTESFSLSGAYRLECKVECHGCTLDTGKPLPDNLCDDYYGGEISDRELIKRYEKYAREQLNKREKLYVIGNSCYGRDINEFFEAFDYEPWEKVPIKKAIHKTSGPMILEQASINELLSGIWDTMGKDIILSITEDEDITERLYRDPEEMDTVPREILREAYRSKEVIDRLNTIPEFENLSPEAQLAHDLAVVYKTDGAGETVSHIDNLDTGDTRLKALAFGFLVALDSGDSRRWKFNQSEIDAGLSLEKHVARLLDSQGDEYADALRDLLKMSGSTSRIVVK